MIFKNNYFKLLAAAFLLFSSFFISRSGLFELTDEAKIAAFTKNLHEKEAKTEKEIISLIKKSKQQNYEIIFRDEKNYYHNLFEDEGILLYIYEKDSLRYWTSNFAPVEAVIDSSAFGKKLLQLKNGWYEAFRQKDGTRLFVGLILLKTEYPFENKYLANHFQDDFPLPDDALINPFPFPSGEDETLNKNTDTTSVPATFETALYKIRSYDRKDLCNIKFAGEKQGSPLVRFLLTLFNIAGFLFLVVFLKAESRKFIPAIGKNKAVFLFIFTLSGLRLAALLLQYPQAFYEMPLFSPGFYATSFLFPSLGDFIINVILIFYIAYYLRRHISLDFLSSLKRVEKTRLFYFLLLSVLGFSFISEALIEGLIQDSNISFNVNNLPELSGYSYGALAAIGLLYFAFFFVCDMVVFVFVSENFFLRQVIPAFAIATIPFILLLFFFDFGPLPILRAAVIFSLIFFIYSKRNGEYGFANIVILISVCAMLGASGLIRDTSKKELPQRKVLAEKLSIEEDPIAEILYSELEPKLLNDLVFTNLKYGLVNYDQEFFDNVLREKYFSGYLSRYDVKSSLFRTDGNPVSPFNKTKHERNYFERLISQNGRPTLNDNMIHIENSDENENYIIRIRIKDRSEREVKGELYITLESKLQPETSGFPELLLDKNVKSHGHLAEKKYSYAKYRKGKLAENYGKFNYSLSLENYGNPDKKVSFFDAGNYRHLVYRTDRKNAVILGKPEEGWLEHLTTFSYLFAVFGIIVLLFLNLRQLPKKTILRNAGFNYKIQAMVVVVMVISMIMFSVGTSFYIYQEYNKKNHSILREKIHSVLIEVENKLSSEEKLDEKLKEYISYILTKFSTVFFTDINMYNLDGTLLASSRQKLFNEGIISRQMDEKAFLQIRFLQKSEFIQDEKIGGLDYLSAYIPFKNKNGEVLAYLNLPYFARQDTLEEEISSFLVALINIYVFLFAFSIIAAIIISNAVTRPLQYIQAMLSRVELGKTNKPIEYKGRDEIGRLVEVYNNKVAELEKSVGLLAKSERESAWREMAKQVAHEIKNPLTPMKLSVQHLNRALRESPANQDELLSRFTNTMIEQIDALSTIASEFSNFAKMPKANNEVLDLVTIIENALHLFNETPDVAFSFKTDIEKAPVFADREQTGRVFINLFQNAIQAIPKEKAGIIKIHLSKKPVLGKEKEFAGAGEQTIIVRIEDNGSGINPSQMDKIFSPNFTTKTAGMGLGLAMVKSIIESANGKIWFETQLGTGTVFYVEMKEWRED